MSRPTLTTARLELRPLGPEHLDDEVALDADPEVMRYITGRARTRAEVVQAHEGRLAAGERVPGLGFWAGYGRREGGPDLRLKRTRPFVGWWILEPVVEPDGAVRVGEAELGYRLHRRFWRRGLASEGARELLRYGFAELGLARINALTLTVNVPSRATMTAVGLRHVRTFHPSWENPPPGSESGEVEYAVTRQDWASGSHS